MGCPDCTDGISLGVRDPEFPQKRDKTAACHGGDSGGIALSVSLVLPDDASFQRQFLLYVEGVFDLRVWGAYGVGGEYGTVKKKYLKTPPPLYFVNYRGGVLIW